MDSNFLFCFELNSFNYKTLNWNETVQQPSLIFPMFANSHFKADWTDACTEIHIYPPPDIMWFYKNLLKSVVLELR